jgi:hypothetical protein
MCLTHWSLSGAGEGHNTGSTTGHNMDKTASRRRRQHRHGAERRERSETAPSPPSDPDEKFKIVEHVVNAVSLIREPRQTLIHARPPDPIHGRVI